MNATDAVRQSQFLSLPYHIRRRIYTLLFCRHSDLQVYENPTGILERRDAPQCLPVQFFRVSHLVSDEAATVFYSCNRFVVSDYKHQREHGNRTLTFLRDIGSVNRGHVRALEIDWVVGIKNATMEFDMQQVVDLLDASRGPFTKSLREAIPSSAATTSSQISDTLDFLNENFDGLEDLTLRIPGHNAGRLNWKHHHSLHGYLSRSADGYSSSFGVDIPFNLGRLTGVKKLSVGNTTDFDSMEDLACGIGVQKLVIFWTEDDEIYKCDIGEFESRGWIFDFQKKEAKKTLLSDVDKCLSSPTPDFLGLPPEIRQIIYRELLTCGVIRLEALKAIRPLLSGRGLLLASRQISQEACAVLYGYNSFNLADIDPIITDPRRPTVYQFLFKMGPSNRRHIRNLSIDCSYAVSESFDGADGILEILYQGYGKLHGRLLDAVQNYLNETESYIERVLEIIGREDHFFNHLELLIPSGKPNPVYYPESSFSFFSEGLFTHSNPIRDNLLKIKHIKKLTVGYTANLHALEECARQMGVWELECHWNEGDRVGDYLGGHRSTVGPASLREQGWAIEEGTRIARKTLNSTWERGLPVSLS